MSHSANFKDLTGKKFGRLTVRKFAGRNEDKRACWECECDCGNTVIVQGKNLRTGNSKSCGCYNIDKIKERNKVMKRKHGETKTKLFHVWAGIKTRCNNPNSISYRFYGERGIEICDEWARSFSAFRDWALANGYREGLYIGRIESDGDYEPGNCRWVTMKENNRNRHSNTLITYNGETHCIAEWAEIKGMRYSILQRRLSNPHFTLEQAFEQPVKKRRA